MRTSRLVALLAALAVGALFVAGLAVEGVPGGLMLAVVAAVLVVLSSSRWAELPPRQRMARGLVIAAVSVAAVTKLAGAW